MAGCPPTPRALAALEERRAREAAALRENLRRRKQQARDRAGAEGSGEGQGAAPDPAGAAARRRPAEGEPRDPTG